MDFLSKKQILQAWREMMKLDKESTIAIVLCLVLLIAWPFLFKQSEQQLKKDQSPSTSATDKSDMSELNQEKQEKTGEAVNPADSSSLKKSEPETSGAETSSAEPVKLGTPQNEKTFEELKSRTPDEKISNAFTELTISPVDGAVISITLKKCFKTGSPDNIVMKQEKPAALSVSLDKKFKLTSVECTEKKDNSLTVVRKFSDGEKGLSLRQSWKLANDYFLDYEFEIQNDENLPVDLQEIRVSAGELPPIHQLTGDSLSFSSSESHTIDTCLASNDTVRSDFPEKKPFEKLQENSAKWIAVTDKYFACVLVPESPFVDGNWMVSRQIPFKDQNGKDADYFILQTSGLIKIKDATLAPGEKVVRKFKYFAGPKEIEQLKLIVPSGAKIMHLGWKWIEGISQWLLVCLIWLKEFSGSYGMSIVLLTVIVKLIFWPITEKANSSMKKMQKIQPMVQEIREKYKKDPQKMNTKVMQLYKEHKVNPMGGCFPIVLQIPVFLALYNTLNGAIELRQSSFLWAYDLSMPDTIAKIPMPGFGTLPLNPLILLMTITMVIQQKITPSTMDPTQQKMMMFMPVVMLVMLYNLPSGLTLYWTISQTISIIQLLVSQKMGKIREVKTA